MEKKVFFSLLCTYYVCASEEAGASHTSIDSSQKPTSFLSRYFPCFKSDITSQRCSRPVCLMSSCCGCVLCYTYAPCLAVGVSGGCLECTRGSCFLVTATLASLKEKRANSSCCTTEPNN